jgi:hypothetical protein
MTGYNPFDAYTRLKHEDRIRFLLRLAHELTIVGRDSYEVGGNGLTCPHRLRALNEVQHRILASTVALLEDNPKRYPDDALLHIILDHPEDNELQRQVLDSFERIMSQLTSAA